MTISDARTKLEQNKKVVRRPRVEGLKAIEEKGNDSFEGWSFTLIPNPYPYMSAQ